MGREKDYSDEKVLEVVEKFNSLSEEEKKTVVKFLIVSEVGRPYVKKRTEDELINSVFTFDMEEFESQRDKTIKDAYGAIDTLVDKVLYGEDKELTDRMTHKFVLTLKKNVQAEEKRLKKERNGEN